MNFRGMCNPLFSSTVHQKKPLPGGVLRTSAATKSYTPFKRVGMGVECPRFTILFVEYFFTSFWFLYRIGYVITDLSANGIFSSMCPVLLSATTYDSVCDSSGTSWVGHVFLVLFKCAKLRGQKLEANKKRYDFLFFIVIYNRFPFYSRSLSSVKEKFRELMQKSSF